MSVAGDRCLRRNGREACNGVLTKNAIASFSEQGATCTYLSVSIFNILSNLIGGLKTIHHDHLCCHELVRKCINYLKSHCQQLE